MLLFARWFMKQLMPVLHGKWLLSNPNFLPAFDFIHITKPLLLRKWLFQVANGNTLLFHVHNM